MVNLRDLFIYLLLVLLLFYQILLKKINNDQNTVSWVIFNSIYLTWASNMWLKSVNVML